MTEDDDDENDLSGEGVSIQSLDTLLDTAPVVSCALNAVRAAIESELGPGRN